MLCGSSINKEEQSLFALSRDEQGTTVTGFLGGENTSTDQPVQTIPPGAQFSLAYTFEVSNGIV